MTGTRDAGPRSGGNPAFPGRNESPAARETCARPPARQSEPRDPHGGTLSPALPLLPSPPPPARETAIADRSSYRRRIAPRKRTFHTTYLRVHGRSRPVVRHEHRTRHEVQARGQASR